MHRAPSSSPPRRQATRQAVALDQILDAAPEAILAVSEHGRIVFANQQTLALFGYSVRELAGRAVDLLVPSGLGVHTPGDDDSQERLPNRRQRRRPGANGRHRDGHEFPVDITVSLVRNEQGPLIVACIRDVSEHVAEVAELTRTRAELQSVLHQQQRLHAVTSLLQTLRPQEGADSVLSLHLESLFPGTSGAVLLFNRSGNEVEIFCSWGPDVPDRERFATSDCWALHFGRVYGTNEPGGTAPCLHVVSDVGGYWCIPLIADSETLGIFHIRSCSLPNGLDEYRQPEPLTPGQQRLAVAVAERLALPLANLKLRETLRNQTIRDGLTGVFNRRYMEEALARELTRAVRHQRFLCVAMLDIDHFKAVNDRFGHAVGDEVLRDFGQFLLAQMRLDDIVCRYGGEEFALILPEASAAAATARVDAVRRMWEARTVDGPEGVRVGTSFSAGVAMFPSDGWTGDALLRTADEIMYRAKAAGRNRVFSTSSETDAGENAPRDEPMDRSLPPSTPAEAGGHEPTE